MKNIICTLVCLLVAAPVWAQPVSNVAKIKSVGKEGEGNDAAKIAWKSLVAQGQPALPEILAGLDDASPVAANWLRSAYEAIVQKSGDKVDPAPLYAFLKDTKHAGIGRRLAYETIIKLDPAAEKKLAPTFLDDPGSELRRDSVALVIADAEKALLAKSDDATGLFQKALKHARDKDQVTLAADRLKKLGMPVDLTKHFGFVTRWSLIGPFDNVKGVGFNAVYPPEKGVDLKSKPAGKEGAPVEWSPHTADGALGLLDLTKAIGPLKGAVAYGYAVVESPAERPIEVRCGSNNAVRMYLNGKEIYAREEYHHGMQMDQHVGKGTLKAGRNEILIKVCQNEQTDSWAQQWSFQLRLCDHLGGAVPFEQK